MIEALLVILLFQLIGEALHAVSHVPIPGPVIGMFLLAAALLMWRRRIGATPEHQPARHATNAALGLTARTLIGHMGLLFVPAGVGIVTMSSLIGAAWIPIMFGLVLSTVLGLLATGRVMHLLSARRARP